MNEAAHREDPPSDDGPRCAEHPDAPAEYLCTECGRLLCRECVTVLGTVIERAYACSHCQGRADPVEYVPPPEVSGQLIRAPLYPLLGLSKWIVLAAGIGALVLWLLAQFSLHAFGAVVPAGAFLAVLTVFVQAVAALTLLRFLLGWTVRVLVTSIRGERRPPGDLAQPWDYPGGFRTLWLTAGAIALPLLPFSVYVIARLTLRGLPVWPVWALLASAGLTVPMFMTRAAVRQSANALNPVAVVRDILGLGPMYLLACGAFWIGSALIIASLRLIPVPGVGAFVNASLAAYFLILQARLIGLACCRRRAQLEAD